MDKKKSDFKVRRRSFLIQLRNVFLISSLQSFSNKVFAISGARMRRARRVLSSGPTLWTWGDSNNGKLGNTNLHRSSPVQIGSLADWSVIAAGDEHSLAIRTGGTLWAFGRDNIGQLGDGVTGTVRSSPVQVGSGTDWLKVAGGGSFSLASKTNKTLWAFGNNGSGRLGIGSTAHASTPVQVGAFTDWENFDGGDAYGAGIRTGGTLWTWGSNAAGQLGDGTNVSKSSPIQIGSGTNWKKVATGYDHCVAVKLDGTLWTWGSNMAAQQGFVVSSPQLVDSVNNWTSIVARKRSTVVGDFQAAGGCAIRSNGTLWCWGANLDGEVGAGSTSAVLESPVQIGSGTDWALVATGPWSTAAIKTNGTLWVWGYNSTGELGLGDRNSRSSPVQVGALSDWSKVSVGESFMLAVKSDFTLWSWGGSSSSGVLGNGTSTAKRSSPLQVGSLSDWSQVVCGARSSCAIKTDGTLWTWGAGTTNQLGTGSSATTSSPVQIGTDTTWTMVSKGTYGGMGIKGGTLWGWGDNADGQLGIGSQTSSRSTPVQVGTDTFWTYVSCGQYDTLGIRSDGSLWNWGTSTNEYNFAGVSNPSQKNSPVRIGSGTTWTRVELGEQGVVALAGGKWWSWGRPFKGALGIVVNSPIQLGSLTTWSDVSAAYYHTVALKTDGTLWNFGANLDGQMGTGSAYEADALPVKVGTKTTWTKIAAGGYTTVALQSDGSAWGWGYNHRGQLGEGTTTSRSSPVQIGSALNWTAIDAGDYHTISIRT